jgi:colanic acid biosynthesis glycosyl transferase WcaI
MRIAFLSQYFHPETFSNNMIARALVQRGHEVHVVCCVPNYPAGQFFEGYSNRARREELWEGIAVHRAWTIPRGNSSASLTANFLAYPFAATWTLMRRLHGRPCVSFVSMPSPLLQALAGVFLRWLRGTPCVYWVQDIWPESATFTLGLTNPLLVRPLTWLCGWLYRRADLVLVQSAAFPAMIQRFGVAPDRIRFFPNTAPATYRPVSADEAPEEALLVPQDGFRLMFAGNIGESQDFDTLIAAADLLRDRPELRWVIVGSGRDMERVQGEIARRGLADRFTFVGRHPEERMPFFFAHSDAMLVSLKDVPIFALTVPYKVQCYMACGKPIVASLSGEGARLVQEAGAGEVAPAGTPGALAEAIRRMLDRPPRERAEMGSRARRYFEEQFAADKVYSDLENWLAEAAGGTTQDRARELSDR